MIAYYGYKDGSGEYFIAIDTGKCDGCGRCVPACPSHVLEIGEDENDPFRELPVAKVAEAERKKLKYTCAPCKPVLGRKELPCILSCPVNAISHSW